MRRSLRHGRPSRGPQSLRYPQRHRASGCPAARPGPHSGSDIVVAPSRRIWIAVVTVASANALPAMTVVTLGIVLPEIRASLGLSEVEAGALFSVLFVAA